MGRRSLPAQGVQLRGARVMHRPRRDGEVHAARLAQPCRCLVPAAEPQQVVDRVDIHEAAERAAHAEPRRGALARVHRLEGPRVVAAEAAAARRGARRRAPRPRRPRWRAPRAAAARRRGVAQEAERDPERGACGGRLHVAAGRGGDGERLLAARAGLRPAPQADQRMALGGEQARPDRRRLVPEKAQRLPVVLERGLVVPRVVLAEPLVEARGALGVGGVVMGVERRPPERERARPVAAVARGLRGPGEQFDAVGALGRGDVPQRGARARSARSPRRTRTGAQLRPASSDATKRVRVRPRALPLVGEPRGRRARLVQGRRDRRVQRGPLGRDETLVDQPRRSARAGARRPRRRGRARAARRRAPRAAPGPGRARAALEHRVRGLPAGGGDDREQRAGGSETAAMRRATTSATVAGTSARPSRRAANSSSTKNESPLARFAARSSASAVGTGSPAIASSSAGHVLAAERLELESRDELDARELRHEPPGSDARARARRCGTSARARSARRPGCGRGTTRSRASTRSAQCTSSSTTSSGAARRRAAEQVEHQLVQPALPEPIREARPAARRGAREQQRRARRGRRRRGRRAPSSSGSVRSAATTGAYGNSSPPNSRLSPCRTRKPQLAPARLERADEAGLADPRPRRRSGRAAERPPARRRARGRALAAPRRGRRSPGSTPGGGAPQVRVDRNASFRVVSALTDQVS